jgi:hypothetical protein
MGFLKNIFGEKAPDWAQPISPQLYKDFQSHVVKAATSTSMKPIYDWQSGLLKFEGSGHSLALSNLIAMWLQAPVDQRQQTAQFFVESLTAAKLDSKIDLEAEKENLKIRVYDFESPGLDNAIKRPIGNYLYELVVLDGDQSISTITLGNVTDPNFDEDRIFEIARKNTWEKVTPSIERATTPDGPLTIIQAPYFGASNLVLLDRYTESGELYWACTPSRDMTLIFKPENPSPDVLGAFLSYAMNYTNAAGNYYILPFVLEYKEGSYRDLCARGEGSITIAQ